MHYTEPINYIDANNLFRDAENNGLNLLPGQFETRFWLHNEKINLDFVLETAKRFPDSKTFIIASGINKGFYIYSTSKNTCLKLVNTTSVFEHAESA